MKRKLEDVFSTSMEEAGSSKNCQEEKQIER